MSALQARLLAELTAARKAQDKPATLLLGTTLSEVKNRAIELKRDLVDDDVIDVVRKGIKKRRESVEMFEKAGRNELAAKERAEITMLERYLPAQVSPDEIRGAVRAAIAAGASNLGAVMGKVVPQFKGRAEGSVINAIARETTAVLDQEELLIKVCSVIQQTFRVGHVSVLLRDDDGLMLRASQGKFTACAAAGGRLPATSGLWGRALALGKTLIEDDVRSSSEYVGFYQETRSRMCIPLVSFGQTLGVLMLESEHSGSFHEGDVESLEAVADICATAIQNAHYVERVKQLAYLDGLTGIFNRRFFELRVLEEIDRARRFNGGMAVVMVDIDQFKRLNDEFGHLLGDEVLRQVSSMFHQQLRKIDVVCRYGGEEFAILLSQTNPQHALAVAEKLRRLVETWQFPGVPQCVTISAGVATYPDHGTTRDELVKSADAGLYAAKQGGRNRVLLGPTRYKAAAQAGTD